MVKEFRKLKVNIIVKIIISVKVFRSKSQGLNQGQGV